MGRRVKVAAYEAVGVHGGLSVGARSLAGWLSGVGSCVEAGEEWMGEKE
jgi:hypothetical protein